MSTLTNPAKMALVVHADMGILSAFQTSLVGCGYVVILARDLPTALLAITQHFFDLAIISLRLAEGGDGWPLAGVVHLVFPQAFVGVLTPETSVLTLQSAINNGITRLFEAAVPPSDVVNAIVREQSGIGVKETRSVH